MPEPSITLTRIFAAPRERVYDLWTKPEHFSVWFGTEDVDVPLDTLTMDVREGGGWAAVMHLPDGSRKEWEGDYTLVDPPARVSLTITDEPANPERALVTVVLTELDGETSMTMTQEVPGFTDEQQAGLAAGYGAFFDTMERVLAGRS